MPNHEVLAVRPDLLPLLASLDGKSARDVRAMIDWEGEPSDTPCEPSVENVAVINVIGAITSYEGFCDWLFGGCSVQAIERQLEAADADPAIKGIYLEVDSPGGQAALIHDLALKIRDIGTRKPVVAMVTGNACSAAYYLASACTEIIASLPSLLGAIGAWVSIIDTSKADEQAGFREITFRSAQSPKKNLDPATEEGASSVQAIVDNFGKIFVEDVAAFRGVAVDTVLTDFGQGDVVVAADAVARKMADRIGTKADAFARVLELASAGASPLTPTTTAGAASASSRHGGNMENEQTVTAEVAAKIGEEAAAAERKRITAILDLRSSAKSDSDHDLIMKAIANPLADAGSVAIDLLTAQKQRTEKIKLDRKADAEDMPDVDDAEPKPDQTTEAKLGEAIAAKFNASRKKPVFGGRSN